MMNHFIVADIHWHHSNIMLYCGRIVFMTEEDKQLYSMWKNNEIDKLRMSQQSVDTMDRHFFDNTNKNVSKNDELWILGDFCWAKKFFQVKDCRDKINCHNIHFIMGNHDGFSRREYGSIFQSVKDYDEIEIARKKIILSHYPMLSWHGMERGSIMCHGHCHGNVECKKQEIYGDKAKNIVDIGIDPIARRFGCKAEDYRPLEFGEIINGIEKG